MAVIEPAKTPASTDPALLPFLQAEFDPVSYLNNTLPTLSTSSLPSRQTTAQVGSLSTLTAETQSLLTRLSTQTARLSNTLTQLSDEIVRSGGRLAYEVELLRGEAIGLTDSLETGLKDDLRIFVPSEGNPDVVMHPDDEAKGANDMTAREPSSGADTTYLERLHVLTTVRERLDAVIKVFDGAMKWPIAPSELASTSSSLISITAPANDEDVRAQEAKAKEFVKEVGQELEELSAADKANGTDSATQRLDELRDIAEVWKGTAEEKARARCVENLQKPLEDKLSDNNRTTVSSTLPKPVDYRYGNLNSTRFSEGSYNFLQSLRTSRD